VYDALNVLEAIGIIRKGEKKQIHWSGQSVISCESNVVKCENDKVSKNFRAFGFRASDLFSAVLSVAALLLFLAVYCVAPHWESYRCL
jgi:hypothetical protein